MDYTPNAGLYSEILENLNTALLLFSGELNLIYLNPAGEALLGISSRQGEGMSATELLPKDQSLIGTLERTRDTQHPFTEREVELRLGNKRIVTADATITPLDNHRVLVELLQVEHHRRITREEHQLTQYQANQALLRGLAHEINNPLGGLRAAAQLLGRELTTGALVEYTQIIINEADRLQNLLQRIFAPYNPPQRCTTNIHEVLERVRKLVSAEASQDIRIQCDYDPSIPTFWADSEQLIQAVLNVMRNAVQALGPEGTIGLRTRTQRQFTIGQTTHRLVARVDIADDGPGISPHLIEKIFYPLVTAQPQGRGLGLSIAQTLINQHGGLIECASRPGETVFTIWLPLENGAPDG